MADKTQATEIRLNGEVRSAAAGETVLTVARKYGIDIPTLCHHEAVEPYGACRLCVVEVEREGRTRVVTACNYLPASGDHVRTDTPRLHQLRRALLQLLLARCPESEVVQRLADLYEVEQSSLVLHSREAPGVNGCILCGLCARVCAEAVGQAAIGYAGRGGERELTSPFHDHAEACIGCGACVYVCPTGALHADFEDDTVVLREFGTRVPLRKCRVCGEVLATVPQLDRLDGKLMIEQETLHTCPACRRAKTRQMAEAALTVQNRTTQQERTH